MKKFAYMRIWLSAVFAYLCAGQLQAAPESSSIDTAKIPVNQWIEISQNKKLPMRFSSIWHMKATDEFFIWGKIGGHRYESKQYEAQTLSLSDDRPEWRESFPKGKEISWAEGNFPNWGCPCHKLTTKPDRPWLNNVHDRWIGNGGAINEIRFVETDGVVRPTRGYTHHQAAYDSKRDRLVYFMGGKTFAYDPKERAWTDLQANVPIGCDGLAWASTAYDPEGDRIVLFGGAYALNPWGGARTWLYDCSMNEWKKAPCKDNIEPPLRASAQLVYDSRNKRMVLFGGHALDRLLADTWTLDLKDMAWKDMKPEFSPPPLDRATACFLPESGKVFLVTASIGRSRQSFSTGSAWLYDVKQNVWTPLPDDLPKVNMDWISCGYSEKHHAVVLASPGVGTWIYKPDPNAPADIKREMVSPGTFDWHPWGRKQTESLAQAPEPDRKARKEFLNNLPVNTVVDADYPGHLISKTWSTAAMDTDRGVVLYVGGGHSGYTGTDYALYDVGANRWSMDAPPCFFPYFSNYNGSLYGWDYSMRPTSQHTYRWYTYDPVSKLMVYCARFVGPRTGFSVLLEDDYSKAFIYDRNKHGQWTFLYDPADNKRYPPVFSRPFGNRWELALVGTPRGVFAKDGKNLYLGTVTLSDDKADIAWTLIDSNAPSGHGEFQPLVYDSKRNRLIFIAAQRGKEVQVWEHPLEKGEWKDIALNRSTPHISREIVYDPESDSLISMPKQKLMVMSFEDLEWKELDIQMPNGSYGTECAMLYDPVHKVCVMLIPKGFSGRMQTFLFRYDPKTAPYNL